MRAKNENFDLCTSCKRLGTRLYMSCMSQKFRLLLASNLSVRKHLFFLLMYPGSLRRLVGHEKARRRPAAELKCAMNVTETVWGLPGFTQCGDFMSGIFWEEEVRGLSGHMM